MPKTKTKSVAEKLLQIRVPESLVKKLRAQAATNAETMTALCRRILIEGVSGGSKR